MARRPRASLPRGRNGDFSCGLGAIVSKVNERYSVIACAESIPKDLESVSRDLPVGMMVCDEKGKILCFNATAQRILGLDVLDVSPRERTRAYGCYLPDTVTPFPEDQLPLARALRGDVVTEVEIFIRNERVPSGVWISACSAPWKGEGGGGSGGVVVFRDITGHKRSVEDVARQVRQRLYPNTAPRLPGFDIAGAAFPAATMGGDLFDFFPMPGECLGLAVADVCGHGIGPSLLMAQTRAYLRSLALSCHDIGELLCRLNEILVVDSDVTTLLVTRLDPRARTLAYASAGHVTGYLLDSAGKVRERLESTGIPLGMLPDRDFTSGPILSLEPGETVALFTDGITKMGEPGDAFGEHRLLEAISDHRHDSASDIVAGLHKTATAFGAERPQIDDMTVVICKVEAAC